MSEESTEKKTDEKNVHWSTSRKTLRSRSISTTRMTKEELDERNVLGMPTEGITRESVPSTQVSTTRMAKRFIPKKLKGGN